MFAMKCLLLLTSCYISSANTVLPLFRPDYVYIKDLDSFYKVHSSQLDWFEARRQCDLEGTELLIPESKTEIDSVLKLTLKYSSLWVGFHDISTRNTFETGDNESIIKTNLNDYNTVLETNTDNNWVANSGEDNKNCVQLLQNGEYKDTNCSIKMNFICKIKSVNITYNKMCKTDDLEYVHFSVTNNCYKIHSLPQTWNNSLGTCLAEGSSLAYLEGAEAKQILFILLARFPANKLHHFSHKNRIHFGFSDLLANGHFTTIKGKHVGIFTNKVRWLPGKPEIGTDKHCGSMNRNGTIDTANCNEKAMFICEKDMNAL